MPRDECDCSTACVRVCGPITFTAENCYPFLCEDSRECGDCLSVYIGWNLYDAAITPTLFLLTVVCCLGVFLMRLVELDSPPPPVTCVLARPSELFTS